MTVTKRYDPHFDHVQWRFKRSGIFTTYEGCLAMAARENYLTAKGNNILDERKWKVLKRLKLLHVIHVHTLGDKKNIPIRNPINIHRLFNINTIQDLFQNTFMHDWLGWTDSNDRMWWEWKHRACASMGANPIYGVLISKLYTPKSGNVLPESLSEAGMKTGISERDYPLLLSDFALPLANSGCI